jgi:hypothetical protein
MADFIGLGVLRHLQGMRALRAQVHPEFDSKSRKPLNMRNSRK